MAKKRREIVVPLAEAQNNRCCYCQFEMFLPDPKGTKLGRMTIEHVIPQAEGGDDSWYNLVAACWLCNGVRQHHNAERFLRIVQKLLLNPIIRKQWHNFSKHEIRLLKKEIMFGRILELAKKDKSKMNYAMNLQQNRVIQLNRP